MEEETRRALDEMDETARRLNDDLLKQLAIATRAILEAQEPTGSAQEIAERVLAHPLYASLADEPAVQTLIWAWLFFHEVAGEEAALRFMEGLVVRLPITQAALLMQRLESLQKDLERKEGEAA